MYGATCQRRYRPLCWPSVGDMLVIHLRSIGQPWADYQPLECSGECCQHIGRDSTGSRPILDGFSIDCLSRVDRVLTDIATDMWIDSRPRYWSIHHSTPPKRYMINFQLLQFFCSLYIVNDHLKEWCDPSDLIV